MDIFSLSSALVHIWVFIIVMSTFMIHQKWYIYILFILCVFVVYVWTKSESPKVAGAKASSWSKMMEGQDAIWIERVDMVCDRTGQE